MTLSRVLKPLIVLAVLGGGGYAAYRYYPRGEAKDASLVGTVERRDLTIKVTVSGGVVPRRMALITPPYNGYVKKLYVGVGQEVKSGAPVVSIAQTVGTNDEEVFPLRSPITGRVVMLNRDEGEYVTTTGDSTIVRIDDLTKLFVEANVPEIEVSKLQIGQPVVIRALALPQKTYDGKIVEIAQSAKNQETWEKSKVEFPMRIEVSNPDAELRSGMSCVLDVIVKDAKGVLSLPHEFVQREGRSYFVTTESGVRKDIEVGMQNDEAFEIKTGVDEGERIRQVDFLKLAEKSAPGGMGGKGGRVMKK